MNNVSNLVKNVFILGLGNVIPKIATFLTLPLLTSFLTTVEYGTYDYILTISSLLIPLCSLQIDQGVFRYIINERDEKTKYSIITDSFFFIIIAIIVCGFITIFVFRDEKMLTALLIASYVGLELFNTYIKQVIRGFKLSSLYSISSISFTLINILSIVLFIRLIEFNLNAAIISLVLSSLISILVLIVFSGFFKYINFSLLNKKNFITIFKYSFPLVPNAISWWILQASNRIIVTNILGLTANAMIAVSNKIPSLINIVYTTFNLAWQESASSIGEDEKGEFYSYIFMKMFEILSSFMILLFSISFPLFKILVDMKYIKAFKFVPLLLFASYFSCFSYFYGGIFVALKKSKVIGSTSIVAAVLNVVVHLILITKLGLYAYCIATNVAYIVMTLNRAMKTRKFYVIKYPVKKMLIIFALMIICAYVFCFLNKNKYIINVVVSLVIILIINFKTILEIKEKSFDILKKRYF